MVNKEVKDNLSKMEFGELRLLIDYCLKNEDTIDKKYLNFVTKDVDKISEYIDILEGINMKKLAYSPPVYSPPENFEKEAKNQKKQLEKSMAFEVLNLSQKYENSHKEKLKNYENSYRTKLNSYENSYKTKLDNYENSIPARIIKRLRAEVANLNSYKLSAQKLNWKLLPTGEISSRQIREYLQEISKRKSEEFDYEKIDRIISLKADKIYCGVDEFEGYLVFYFQRTKMAILDCPKKGNAIYIFGENWKNLSRLTKSELLSYYSDKTERIIHRGDWFNKLKSFMKISF